MFDLSFKVSLKIPDDEKEDKILNRGKFNVNFFKLFFIFVDDSSLDEQ